MDLFPSSRFRQIQFLFVLSIIIGFAFYFLSGNRYRESCLYVCALEPNTTSRTIFSVPSLHKPIEFEVDFFGLRYRGRSGNILDDEILFLGASEKEVLFFLRDTASVLREANMGEQISFIDIGANVGQHTLFMSLHTDIVHAFEPFPPVIERLEQLLTINGIKNVEVHKVGLGKTEETIPFHPPRKDNLGGGSFDPSSSAAVWPNELPIVIGDKWFKEHEIKNPLLFKIDVEGFEKKVLAGLRETLETNRPVIVTELNIETEISYTDEDDFVATFPSEYFFLRFSRESNGLTGEYILEPFSFTKASSNFNIVAIPQELQSLIPHRLSN